MTTLFVVCRSGKPLKRAGVRFTMTCRGSRQPQVSNARSGEPLGPFDRARERETAREQHTADETRVRKRQTAKGRASKRETADEARAQASKQASKQTEY